MTVFVDDERITPLMINDVLYNINGGKQLGWVIGGRVGFMAWLKPACTIVHNVHIMLNRFNDSAVDE